MVRRTGLLEDDDDALVVEERRRFEDDLDFVLSGHLATLSPPFAWCPDNS